MLDMVSKMVVSELNGLPRTQIARRDWGFEVPLVGKRKVQGYKTKMVAISLLTDCFPYPLMNLLAIVETI